MNNSLVMSLVFVFAIFLSGCVNSSLDEANLTPEGGNTGPESPATGEGSKQPEPEASDTPISETPDRLDLRLTQTPPSGLERVEIPEGAPQSLRSGDKLVTGEVPLEIVEEILADMVERSGAEVSEIMVMRAEAVVWNDGALGCPKPGEFYIQMLINGYWVVLEMEEVEYDYRVSDKGHFKLCEGRGGLPPISPPGNGPTPDQ